MGGGGFNINIRQTFRIPEIPGEIISYHWVMMNIVNFMIMAMVMILMMVIIIIIIMKKCSKSRRCVGGVGGGQIGLFSPPYIL